MTPSGDNELSKGDKPAKSVFYIANISILNE